MGRDEKTSGTVPERTVPLLSKALFKIKHLERSFYEPGHLILTTTVEGSACPSPTTELWLRGKNSCPKLPNTLALAHQTPRCWRQAALTHDLLAWLSQLPHSLGLSCLCARGRSLQQWAGRTLSAAWHSELPQLVDLCLSPILELRIQQSPLHPSHRHRRWRQTPDWAVSCI